MSAFLVVILVPVKVRFIHLRFECWLLPLEALVLPSLLSTDKSAAAGIVRLKNLGRVYISTGHLFLDHFVQNLVPREGRLQLQGLCCDTESLELFKLGEQLLILRPCLRVFSE